MDLSLDPLETHVYLAAFLRSEGLIFDRPYTQVRSKIGEILEEVRDRKAAGQAPSADVADSRLRTWKAVFESFGFLSVDSDSRIRLTPLGQFVSRVQSDLNDRLEGANDHLAKLGISVLSRHRLRNPLDGKDYPIESDLHPYRFVWRAMRSLDNRLHSEELNRVLMKVFYEQDVDAAIAHIRSIRRSVSGAHSSKDFAALGEAVVNEGSETKRRITPWFAKAGFGGLLIEPEDRADGFRHLVEKYVPLIDEAIAAPLPTLPVAALESVPDYLRYLTSTSELTQVASPTDEQRIGEIVDAVKRFGSRKVICLSGIPGTGKTRIAKLAASRLVENDPYRYSEVQFHETTSYEDFIEGFVPKPGGEGFELMPKTFRVINRRALLDPAGSTYVLLIEEFTRANVHAVLGELLTYVEHRDRPFRLALSQKDERVATNLVVMATMNPRDKSAIVLDQAIVRRLHRVSCESSTDQLKDMLVADLPAGDLARLSTWFEKHRKNLPFGHGVFSGVHNERDLRDVWHGTIVHFLSDIAGDIRLVFKDIAEDYPWK